MALDENDPAFKDLAQALGFRRDGGASFDDVLGAVRSLQGFVDHWRKEREECDVAYVELTVRVFEHPLCPAVLREAVRDALCAGLGLNTDSVGSSRVEVDVTEHTRQCAGGYCGSSGGLHAVEKDA